MKSILILFFFAINLPLDILAQQCPPQTVLALYGGTGVLSVQDEFISLRKYSGQFSTFGAEWAMIEDSVRNTFAIEYQRGSSIRNNHSEADIAHMRLIFDHQTFYRRISVFGMDADWYLGPAGITALHIRTQHVAMKENLSDFLSLYQENSIAVSTTLQIPLSEDWSIHGSAVFDAVTIGLKLVDNSEPQKEQAVKVLFPWKNLNGRFDLGAEFHVGSNMFLSCKYVFQFVRNTAWDALTLAGDNVMVRVAYAW